MGFSEVLVGLASLGPPYKSIRVRRSAIETTQVLGMETPQVARLVLDLLLVLVAGLAAGVVCKRLGLSVLTGYLIVGALLGEGGGGLVGHREHLELGHLAEAGALLLLFSIGIEFSLQELIRMGRYFFVGGALQMALSAAPVIAAGMFFGLTWRPAVFLGRCGGHEFDGSRL